MCVSRCIDIDIDSYIYIYRYTNASERQALEETLAALARRFERLASYK